MDEMNKEQNEIIEEQVEDVKDEIVEEVNVDEKPEEKEELQKEETSEEPKEEVQEDTPPTEETDEEKEDVEEHKEGVEDNDSETEDAQENTESDVEENEESEVEKSEREIELEKQLAEFESEKFDREAMATIDNIEIAVENKANEIRNQVVQALEAEALRYGIPLDKTMEELEKENPTMARVAAQIRANAEAILEQQMAQLQVTKEMETAKIVFTKASKMFEQYKLTPEQEDVAAVVFADIVRQVGVNDLGEDLKAKVKLAAAQAIMDVPANVQKAVEEIKEEADTSVLETPTEKIEEKPEVEVEEKPVEPPTPVEEVDLDSFTESATEGKAQGVASVNADNVLEKMAALPFKERTAFYREHIDLINEVMRKRR